jgi:hypothetical protein
LIKLQRTLEEKCFVMFTYLELNLQNTFLCSPLKWYDCKRTYLSRFKGTEKQTCNLHFYNKYILVCKKYIFLQMWLVYCEYTNYPTCFGLSWPSSEVSSTLIRNTTYLQYVCLYKQWRAVHGSKGSIASVVKKRKEKNSYINNSIWIIRMWILSSSEQHFSAWLYMHQASGNSWPRGIPRVLLLIFVRVRSTRSIPMGSNFDSACLPYNTEAKECVLMTVMWKLNSLCAISGLVGCCK